MPRRMAALATCGLVALVLAVYLPAATLVYPPASPVAGAAGERAPASTLEPLAEYTKDTVIPLHFESQGTAGSSGVFWTELYYRIPGMSNWTFYAPPWNSGGQWYGARGFELDPTVKGAIPFDTYYTGGEQVYEFATIAVDRGYWREPGPESMKARTTLDTRPPQVFVASPTPGAWTKDTRLSWVAEDAVSGVAYVEVAVDGQDPDRFTVPEGSTNLLLDGEGGHTAFVRAADRAGNTADVYIPFHYDPNAPTLSITAPARDGYVKDPDVEVRWTAGDSASGIAALRLSLDSNPPVELAANVTSYLLPGLTERSHVVSLLAMDLAGNIATETISFGVDATPPELTLLAPGEYSNKKDLQVLWLGLDAASGMDRFELTLDDGATVTLANAAGYTFDDVPEGAHSVRVRAVDRAGNSVEATREVVVDATAPTVSITSPAAGVTAYGNVYVNWTATESGSGVARIELSFDDKLPIVVTGAQSHRIEDVSQAAHYVLVRVTDRAGNVGEAALAFVYGGPGPGGGPSAAAPLDFWVVMLILAAIAGGTAYFAIRLRKKSQA